MNLPVNGLPKRLPHRFPVGATYVVEGYGGKDGDLRVISRYVVLPSGRRINIPSAVRPPMRAAAVAFSRTGNSKQSQEKTALRGERKKFAGYAGTERGRPS
ncbi:MAG: hypothetical protein WBF03_02710 [Xanthobacteraceae bacterium]